MPRLARSFLPIARALSQPSTSSIARNSSLTPLRNLATTQTPLVYISQSLSALSISTPSRATSLARLSTSSLSTSPLTHFVRYKTLGTFYQPSQRRRKRKHGFLSRIKTHNGRKMIKRRALKGRRFLSH